MHRPHGSSSSSAPDKIFGGVRFVLFGFDSVSEAQVGPALMISFHHRTNLVIIFCVTGISLFQYRSELVRRGGIDVGRYDRSCTHVIVSGRVYVSRTI